MTTRINGLPPPDPNAKKSLFYTRWQFWIAVVVLVLTVITLWVQLRASTP
jgi:hypothetical protein